MMAVYVDDVRHRFGRMIMCHMWADSDHELHVMADFIGVARRWHQKPPKASWSHYDISLGKKQQALRHGAILTDKLGPVEFQARQNIASGEPARVERGKAMLQRIREARERDTTTLLLENDR